MNGFGIYIKNTLLEKKHHDQMGKAVWLYMWFLDKMTSVSEEGVGKVLGGKPIKQTDFSIDLQLSKSTYFRYLETLRKFGYVTTIQTPYGLSILVNKANKIFGNKPVDNSKKRIPKSEYSRPKGEYSRPKSEYSNKTIQLDNTVDIKELNKKKLEKAVDNSDHRGKPSPAAERIREALKNGELKKLILTGG